MPTIKKSLSSKVDGDGKSEILLRFSGGRDAVFRVKSGIRIPPARWNAAEGRITLPRLETPEQRELIRAAGVIEEAARRIESIADDEDIEEPADHDELGRINVHLGRLAKRLYKLGETYRPIQHFDNC